MLTSNIYNSILEIRTLNKERKMLTRKILNFIQEIGTIMYVGGILSHIVISNVLGHSDPLTALNVYTYKELSAYILILPGLGLKVLSDILLYRSFEEKPNWLKLKFLMIIFLTINAFVFLVPMMPELVELANLSVEKGTLSQEFLDTAQTEAIVGASNAIPLLLEILLGSFKPKLFSEKNAYK
jgi:hypothetical protein